MDLGKSEEEQKEYNEMKNGVLKGARDLIDYHKRMTNTDPYTNIVAETNRLEK